MVCRTITFASLLVLLFFCSLSPAAAAGGPNFELNVTERYEFYDIQAQTLDDLRQQIGENGTKWGDGNVYSGVTSWDIKYIYDISADAGSYFVPSARTRVEIVYRLPRIVPALTDPALAQLWDAYLERLKHHEFGHKALAVKTASEVNEIFATLPTCKSREQLAEEVRRRTEESFRELKAVQVAYDDETRHGVTQGAFLADAPRLARN